MRSVFKHVLSPSDSETATGMLLGLVPLSGAGRCLVISNAVSMHKLTSADTKVNFSQSKVGATGAKKLSYAAQMRDMWCVTGCVGFGARAGQGRLHLSADQLVPAGQGQVQGAHLCSPGAGPAQGLLGGAGQGGLRPGHQLQAVEGVPLSPTPTPLLLPMSCSGHREAWTTHEFVFSTPNSVVPEPALSSTLQLSCPRLQACICSMHHGA